MSPDEFIHDAIDLGSQNGVASLDPVQRAVFLISEAEVDCDMNGIDSFLDRYGSDWLSEAATAFESIGAMEIAKGLRAINPETRSDDTLLDHINDLITSRTGYAYESIERFVQRHQTDV